MQPDPTNRWTRAVVRAIDDPAEHVRAIALEPADPVRGYAPGSHIELEVQIAGEPATRSYSLVGEAPQKGALWIAVKRVAESRGGSRYMWSLRPGARLRMCAPENHFPLALGAPEYLLVAGGIGITPLFGMAETLARTGARFRLLYAGQTRAKMAYLAELQARFGERVQAFVAAEGRRLDVSAALAGLHAEGELYVCGPIRLMEAARRAWLAAGRRLDRFRLETFGASGHRPAQAFEVLVRDHQRALSVAREQSLLEALRGAGIDLPGHCRRGECGLCAVRVLALDGELDHRDVFFGDQEKSSGHALCACVSRALGRIEIDTGYRP